MSAAAPAPLLDRNAQDADGRSNSNSSSYDAKGGEEAKLDDDAVIAPGARVISAVGGIGTLGCSGATTRARLHALPATRPAVRASARHAWLVVFAHLISAALAENAENAENAKNAAGKEDEHGGDGGDGGDDGQEQEPKEKGKEGQEGQEGQEGHTEREAQAIRQARQLEARAFQVARECGAARGTLLLSADERVKAEVTVYWTACKRAHAALAENGPRLLERYRCAAVLVDLDDESLAQGTAIAACRALMEAAAARAKRVLDDGGIKKAVVVGVERCRACRSFDVDVDFKQTRSADEPMTAFIACNACGARSKKN